MTILAAGVDTFEAALLITTGAVWAALFVAGSLRNPQWNRTPFGAFWTIVLCAVALPPAFAAIAAPPNRGVSGALEFGPTTQEVLRVLLIVFVSACAVVALARFSSLPRRGREETFLFLGAIFLILVPLATTPLTAHPVVHEGSFLLPAAFTALFVTKRPSLQSVTTVVRSLANFYVIGALVALVIDASTVSYAYSSLFGWPTLRLYGFTLGATSLGPIAVLQLVLELRTARPTVWRAARLLAGLTVLFLAQSKTAWLVAFSVAVVLWLYRKPSTKTVLRPVAFAYVGAGVAVLIALALSPTGTRWAESISTEGGSLATLSSRTYVWDVTIRTWEKNKTFGYGADLWSEDFRRQLPGLFRFAGEAHNQFLQTLGANGVVGLVMLCFYLFAVLRIGIQKANQTRGWSLALVVLMLEYAISDAWMTERLLSTNAFLHVAIFALFLVLAGQPSSRREQPAPRATQQPIR
jgi:exopolysaccharide production protein ExoQ